MPSCPTLVIAGTHSGSGKTSLTLALTRALTRRGFAVQTFKTGPDFLDPTYLALASGRPCHNLDGWMAGRQDVCRLFARATADADCALIEGVMGLFDGADAAGDEGSTAELARWLDAAVLLVVNVHGMGRSIAALVKGFVSFAPALRFAGIVANHCGSDRHAAWLADSLAAAALPPLVAAIPRGSLPELPSRHLGLVTADTRLLSEQVLDALADALERHCPLDRLLPQGFLPGRPEGITPGAVLSCPGGNAPLTEPDPAPAPEYPCVHEALSPSAPARTDGPRGPWTAQQTPPATPDRPARNRRRHPEQASLFSEAPPDARPALPASSPTPRTGGPPARLKIGVALDAAFHFYYPDLFNRLADAGCDTVFFSPLADRRLPEGICALYLGGGYPEAHAAALSANAAMLEAIRGHVASGKPLYAECGGLMYLSRGLSATDGFFHSFLGILPARTRMLAKKRALGYVEVTLTADSLWGRSGDLFRGHEFHYSELSDDPTAADPSWQRVYSLRRRRAEPVEAEGFQKGAVLASYTHLYYAPHPAAITYFINYCGDRG
jgi:cobyrinic acid a,c-diamide synthase